MLGVGLALAGCVQTSEAPARAVSRPALRVGFGFIAGQNPARGIHSILANLGFEGLVVLRDDGRPEPALADSWAVADDGLQVTLRLRRGVRFYDGKALDASAVRDVLLRELPNGLGPAYDDINQIQASSDSELTFHMKRRSALLLEGLDVSIDSQRVASGGTGKFVLVSDTGLSLIHI